MALKYFLPKSLISIYEEHKRSSKSVIVIYEDTKNKTRYKCVKYTTDREFERNGFGYFIVLVQDFYSNGYCSTGSSIMKSYKKRIDFLKIVDYLIDLFD